MSRHVVPKNLIRFAGKTGFVTKATWRAHFCEPFSERGRRDAWINLRDRGYFLTYPDKRCPDVLILNGHNSTIRCVLGQAPVHKPAMTQLIHDEILFEGILRTEREGLIAGWQSEAELKSMPANDYRIETQGELIKYPDAVLFLRQPESEFTLAVELERTLKTRKRYNQILGAYASMRRVNAILYVVGEEAIARSISGVAKEIFYPEKDRPIRFTSLEEWQRDPTSAIRLAHSKIGNTR